MITHKKSRSMAALMKMIQGGVMVAVFFLGVYAVVFGIYLGFVGVGWALGQIGIDAGEAIRGIHVPYVDDFLEDKNINPAMIGYLLSLPLVALVIGVYRRWRGK